jgi:hypothetical protein
MTAELGGGNVQFKGGNSYLAGGIVQFKGGYL